MTAGIPQADPRKCPDCEGPIERGDPACGACGLPLRGPLAVDLWNVTVRLNQLLAERESLLWRLRVDAEHQARTAAPPPAAPPVAPVTPATAYAPAQARQVPVPPPPAPVADWGPVLPSGRREPSAVPLPPRPPRQRREWTAKRVQNLLLTLGVLLLVVAAVIFAVVAWGRLGIEGRALVLAAATAGTGWGAYQVNRRDLTATAEALGSLMLALLFLDAYAVRRLGLFGLDGPRTAWFWAGAVAVVAGIAGAYATKLPLRVLRWSAAIGVQLPAPIAVLDSAVDVPAKSIVLSAQSAVVLAASRAIRSTLGELADIAAVGAGLAAFAALPLALNEAFADQARRGALALVALAGVAALAAWLHRDRDLVRDGGSGSATALLLLAVAAVGIEELPFEQLPALLAASGLLAVVGSAALPFAWRRPPLWVGAAGVALPVLLVAKDALTGLFGPYAWLEAPWSLAAGSTAREALTPRGAWQGTVVVLVVLLVAAATALLLGELGGQRERVFLPVTLTVALAVLLVPLGRAWSYDVAIVWDVVGGAALTAVSVPLRRGRALTANALYVSGLVVLSSTVMWSLADDGATLLALAAGAVLMAGVALLDRATSYLSAGIATALGCGWVLALALSRGTPVDRSGFFLALAGAACVAAGLVARRIGQVVAGVGSVAYTVGAGLSAADAGWFSWSLAAGAVAAVAVTAFGSGPRVVPAGTAAAFACAWVLPFAGSIGTPVDRSGFFVALAGAACAAGGLVARDPGRGVAGVGAFAYSAGFLMSGTDAGWLSWTLAAGAVAAVVVAAYRPAERAAASGLAAAFACGWVYPFALSRGTPDDRSAFLLALAGAVFVVGGYAVRGLGRYVAPVGGLAYLAGTFGSAGDAGWLSWCLAAGALAVAAVAVLDAERRAPWAGLSSALGCGWLLAFSISRDVPLDRAGFLLVATGAVLAVGGTALRPLGTYVALVGAGAYVAGGLLTATDVGWASWSLAAGAVAAAAVALLEPAGRAATAAVAAALGCAWSFTFAVWRETPYDRAGFLLALAGCAAVGAGALVARHDRWPGGAVEVVGAIAYALAIVPAGTDPGWVSWTFAAGGLTALADALRDDRRHVAWLGGVLLSAWAWVRLWLEDVHAPEAYAAPIAVTALVLGHLRRRADERVGSWAAYGPGLATSLGPSLYVAIGDPGLTRPLLLGLAALVVVLWGARERLQAPIVLGGITLAVDAVVQVAPYVGGLPRWIPIAAAGVLLIAVGVTFEQRRRDFDRMKDRFEAMT